MFRKRCFPVPAGPLALAATITVVVGLAVAPAHAAEAPVDLGSAQSFAVLAGQSVTNTGPTVVTGDLGVSPGSSVTGMPPLVIVAGAPHVTDSVASLAQSDLTKAYDSAAGRPTVTSVTGKDLGGMTLTSGVVEHTSGMQLTGTVTLDAQGDPAAVFIFKAGSTLVTAPNSTVSLINGASPCNVFWQVGSSATLDTNTAFAGSVMALTSVSLGTGASVRGRVLARNGSVTLDTNVITRPDCAAATPTSSVPTPTPTAATTKPAASPSPTGNPSDAAESTGSGGGNDVGTGQASTPVVPEGHPETGLGGAATQPDRPARLS